MEVLFSDCKKHDKEWQKRVRSIDTLFIFIFIAKIHSKAKNSFRKTLASISLESYCPSFALSSVSTARKKVGYKIWVQLLRKLYILFKNQYGHLYLWKGLQVYAIDGSKTNLPRELLKLKYKKPSPKSYYPQGMISVLYDVQAEIPFNISLWRHNHERAAAKEHLRLLGKDSLVIYDRLYFARWLYEEHIKRQIQGLFRNLVFNPILYKIF